MAYSSGFNPHPRISYINPAPTGVESVAEFLVIALSQFMDPERVRTGLDAVMPEGFPIIAVEDLPANPVWGASLWEVEIPGADPDRLRTALETFMVASEWLVAREVKAGLREFDARGAVEVATLVAPRIVSMVIRHTEPLVRPDDVIQALGVSDEPALIRRCAQMSG